MGVVPFPIQKLSLMAHIAATEWNTFREDVVGPMIVKGRKGGWCWNSGSAQDSFEDSRPIAMEISILAPKPANYISINKMKAHKGAAKEVTLLQRQLGRF